MSTDLRTVMERISAEYYQLTTSERKVAAYITDHQPGTQIMSLSDLAEASGVAEATITRFCRKLGYKGYNAFQLGLANNVARRRGIPFPSGEVAPAAAIPGWSLNLAGAGGAAPARHIARVLAEEVGWNVNTTYPLIKRCIKKGAIERTDPGFLCHALIGKEAVQEAETNELINRIYDGSADKLFAALLGRKHLSQEQIEALKRIVGELE